MRNFYHSVAAVAFIGLGLGSIGAASAAPLHLTAAQQQAIVQSVQTERGQTAPAGFLPKVGGTLPKTVSSHKLPSTVAAQVPEVKGLKFVKFDNNEILLITKHHKRVAGIIMLAGTTGAAPAAPVAAPKPAAAAAPKPAAVAAPKPAAVAAPVAPAAPAAAAPVAAAPAATVPAAPAK
jgi:hypothetical protein